MPADILLFLSDQHAAVYGPGGRMAVDTPNLDDLCRSGTSFTAAYTPCPLCVPARMAMLSSLAPHRTGIYTNNDTLPQNIPTFLHAAAAAGYETVLCGRMHFVGPDQRHGFSKRIAGDITAIYHNRPNKAFAAERGVHDKTPQGGPSCLSIIGGGNSPTLEFDRYVVENAEQYLRGSYEKPQFLCVGTYGPHHPYVAPKELYEYYYDKVSIPEQSFSYPEHPAIRGKILQDTDPEVVRAVRAAYYGMVEFEDALIGRVYDAFQEYLARNGREGVFVYVSDHGEHAGYRGYYGKSTFYEPSVHIPMLFAGQGIAKGRRCYGAVSLLDVAPTLCGIAGAVTPPEQDGVSLLPQLCGGEEIQDRMVISETGGTIRIRTKEYLYGQMVRCGRYKYVHYEGFDAEDRLFDVDQDPEETVNVMDQHPDLVDSMRKLLAQRCAPSDVIRQRAEEFNENLKILGRCDFDNAEERWHAPDCARHYPEHMVSSRRFGESK